MNHQKSLPLGLPSPDEVRVQPELAVACYQQGQTIFDAFILWLELRYLNQALIGEGFLSGQIPFLESLFWLEEQGWNIIKVEELLRAREGVLRYQSFHTYFGHIKRLGWVEETGRTDPSEFQEDYPNPPASPRVFYRLTAKGRRATEGEWSDPITALYKYSRAVRSSKKQRYYWPPQGQRGRPQRRG